jgi:murein DD-endopeptidase MepM/ murein hydrolase activator NlpD
VRLRSIGALSSLLAVQAAALPAQTVTPGGSSTLEVITSARAVEPGELVVVTIRGAERAERVQLTVFDQSIRAYRTPNRTWQALIGIDLERRAGRYALTTDAKLGATRLTDSRALVVQAKQFATRTLRVAPEFVDPPPAVQTRIQQEAAFLREVFSESASDRLWHEPFVRPVPDPANSRFGVRSVFNGRPRSPHSGTDFPALAGTPVKAPNAGRVRAARDLFFSGQTVVIDHGMRMFSTLAHLSRIDVREGEMVAPGHVVGLVGATGRVTGPHLHWALRLSEARIDPLSALALLGSAPAAP